MRTISTRINLENLSIMLYCDFDYIPGEGVYMVLWEAMDVTGLATSQIKRNTLRTIDLNSLPVDDLVIFTQALDEININRHELQNELEQDYEDFLTGKTF